MEHQDKHKTALNAVKNIGSVVMDPRNLKRNFISSADPQSKYPKEGLTMEPRKYAKDISTTVMRASTYPSDSVAATTEATVRLNDYSNAGSSGLNTDDLESFPINIFQTSGHFGNAPKAVTSGTRNDGHTPNLGLGDVARRFSPALFNQMRDSDQKSILESARLFKNMFFTPLHSLMETFGKDYVK